jgi:hypothetical protein
LQSDGEISIVSNKTKENRETCLEGNLEKVDSIKFF